MLQSLEGNEIVFGCVTILDQQINVLNTNDIMKHLDKTYFHLYTYILMICMIHIKAVDNCSKNVKTFYINKILINTIKIVFKNK